MKKYKYRGLAQLSPTIYMGAVLALAYLITQDGVVGLIIFGMILLVSLPEFIRWRRMSLNKWKKEMAQYDERYQLARGKAAQAAYFVGIPTAMVLGILIENGKLTMGASAALRIVILVYSAAFIIGEKIYEKFF